MAVDHPKSAPKRTGGSNDYVLPKVKARRGEDADMNGRRPVTVRELARRAKARQRGGNGLFGW